MSHVTIKEGDGFSPTGVQEGGYLEMLCTLIDAGGPGPAVSITQSLLEMWNLRPFLRSTESVSAV